MRAKLARALAWLAALGTCLALLVLLDLVPALRPEPPARTKFDPKVLVERPAVTGSALPKPAAVDAGPERAPRAAAWRIPLCEGEPKLSRIYRLALATGLDSLLIWCKREYLRVDLAFDQELPRAQRVARFPARVELPGGAVAGDFDADGVLDLVLATAPPAQVLHRPGAGAYFLKGRQAGGYERAQALAETPIQALLAVSLDEQPGLDLALLTRGDLTAQRPGELWLLRGGATFQRLVQLPLGLGARELSLVRFPGASHDTLWSALAQAASVVGVELTPGIAKGETPTKRTLAAPGTQGLLSGLSGANSALWTRDSHDVRTLATPDGQALETWAAGVNLGPGVLADLDGDSQPEVVSLVEGGLVRVRGPAGAEEELRLAGQVLDVTVVRDAAQRERAALLSAEVGSTQLSLLILPKPPWAPGLLLDEQRAEASELPGMAVVALD